MRSKHSVAPEWLPERGAGQTQAARLGVFVEARENAQQHLRSCQDFISARACTVGHMLRAETEAYAYGVGLADRLPNGAYASSRIGLLVGYFDDLVVAAVKDGGDLRSVEAWLRETLKLLRRARADQSLAQKSA